MCARRSTAVRFSWQSRLPAAACALFSLLLTTGTLSPALAQNARVDADPSFNLTASVRMSRGYISQAGWLDDGHLLTLVITPNSAEVWRTDIDTLERDRFISGSLLTGHICPLELTSRLGWTLSPQRNYIFFKWFGDQGTRHWALLDIADAPRFRLKQFTAPSGMQISRVLFSANDRYAAFIDDSFIEGSSTSVLVMNLDSGEEAWRIASQQLSFVVDEWWREDLGPDTMALAASLFDGEFYPTASLATASIPDQAVEFSPAAHQLIAGTGADWGWAACSQVSNSTNPRYYMEIYEHGGGASRIELDLRPIDLQALQRPGCVLLLNSADLVTSKLWLVSTGSTRVPTLVDADCRDVAVSAGGKLLVLAGGSNEIRIYEPQ